MPQKFDKWHILPSGRKISIMLKITIFQLKHYVTPRGSYEGKKPWANNFCQVPGFHVRLKFLSRFFSSFFFQLTKPALLLLLLQQLQQLSFGMWEPHSLAIIGGHLFQKIFKQLVTQVKKLKWPILPPLTHFCRLYPNIIPSVYRLWNIISRVYMII